MHKEFPRRFISFICILCFAQFGCNQVSLTKKSIAHTLIPQRTQPAQSNLAGKTVNLNGQWTIGYRLQGSTIAGSMFLKQNGQSFSGNGADGDHGLAFKIERGSIKDNEIIFLKRYESNPNVSVQYHGQFSFISDGQQPYMGGEFSFERNGHVIAGDWEALQIQPAAAVANSEQPAVEQPPAPQPTENVHIPDLSGKWHMAFEYNFKIIHSTLFLEQNGNHLTGHGSDDDTGNHFVIKNGWYKFPHIGFTRDYVHTKAGRAEMTFKADMTVVNDKDYQGPYLSGKTQGGGNWEAQRVN